MKRYDCAICKRHVRYEGRLPDLYPFCSERCKWVDFGRWLNGEYSIERDLMPEDCHDTSAEDSAGAAPDRRLLGPES